MCQSAVVNRTKRPRNRRRLTGRRRARRTGVVALALLLGTAAATLVLARRYHLGVAATLVAILGGLPGLYLAWAAYRDSQAKGDALTLAEIANQLAAAVDAQWRAEAALRRLNDPYPLPVSWTAADASLSDGWDVLVTLATSGAGWGLPAPPGTWADRPDSLAGGGGDLAGILARVPTGRLVVLGEPGAGKTMLMVRLVLDLLARRASGGPVPVLASLVSWNPADQDLHGWLSAQLTIDYPALAAAAPSSVGESTRMAALLATGLILPILDGLDEIPDAIRGPAITRINDALDPGEQVVVSSRTEPYRDAVRPPGGVEVTLRGAAAIQLCPLDPVTVSRYLRDDAGGPATGSRWDPVLATLGTQVPTGQALTTPLMVGLARMIYNPRPGEHAGTLRDPAELCDAALADRAAVERHLFDAFIRAAYRPKLNSARRDRWSAQEAERWLVLLARLQHTTDSPSIAWWQLRYAVPLSAAGLAGGLAAGLVAGLAAGLVAGLLSGPWAASRSGSCSGSPAASRLGSSSGWRSIAFTSALTPSKANEPVSKQIWQPSPEKWT